jgi:hypothetical protein
MGLTCSLCQNFSLSDCDLWFFNWNHYIEEMSQWRCSNSVSLKLNQGHIWDCRKQKGQNVSFELPPTKNLRVTASKLLFLISLIKWIIVLPSVTIWDNITMKLNMCLTNALHSPQKVVVHLHCDCICPKMQVKMDIVTYKNMVRI